MQIWYLFQSCSNLQPVKPGIDPRPDNYPVTTQEKETRQGQHLASIDQGNSRRKGQCQR